ncbi:pentatricopeptide repeat-containing protein At4g17616-like [Wolffia australiana]
MSSDSCYNPTSSPILLSGPSPSPISSEARQAAMSLPMSCFISFGDSLVAHQVFEVMLKIGLTADLTSLAAIAKICEMNGLREDLRKLSSFVDSAASLSLNHHCCRSFYESLLSLHFKFNDLDAASGLIVGLYRRSGAALPRAQIPESAVLQVGSGNLKAGSKLLIKLSPLERGLFIEPERRSDLIVLEGGNVLPSKRAVAKLVLGYIRQKKTGDLAKVLVEIQKAVGLSSLLNFSLGFEVVVSSVELGWLEAAHDVLDDMESAGFLSPEAVYVLLLKAYFDKSMVREARALLKQMRERKLIKFPDEDEDEEEVINSYLAQHEKRASPVASSSLTKLLEKQSKEGGDSQSHLTHEFNFSIFFFCKAGMMEDAIKTYRKMQEKRVLPSIQTFSHLVNGYSSKEMYREITIVWGEMRRRLEEGVLSADRDLLGSFLWNFIRGGYFERAMDIATYLEDSGIYIDKWRFREEFLRLHRNLYRSLNMCDARTEVQSKRLEHVRAFRKWVGIDGEKRTRARG